MIGRFNSNIIIDGNFVLYGRITGIDEKNKYLYLDCLEFGTLRILGTENLLKNSGKKLHDLVGVNVQAKQNLSTNKFFNISLISFIDYTEDYNYGVIAKFVEDGTEAWKDVHDISAWLKDIRGY